MGSSRVLSSNGGSYPGVPVHSYESESEGSRAGVAKRVLSESIAEDCGFEARSFSLAPGTQTGLERHSHAHFVLVTGGSGTAVLETERTAIETGDAVSVASQCVHQFRADRGGPLSFLCVVDQDRDRPEPVLPDREKEDC